MNQPGRQKPQPPHWRKISVKVARSRSFDRAARLIVNTIVGLGMVLVFIGLMAALGRFSTQVTSLAQFAGGGGEVAGSTVSAFQNQILLVLGLGGEEISADLPGLSQPPDQRAALAQTLEALRSAATQQAAPAESLGFVPYRVSLELLEEHAPELEPTPTEVLPVTGGEPIEPTSTPEPTPVPSGPPTRVVIPRIGLDAPVSVAFKHAVVVEGQTFQQWEAPEYFAAGWQEGSAAAGAPGNTVINGHHNIYGMVFARLVELEQGDEIFLYSGDTEYRYVVSQSMTLEERDAGLAQRQENARWILPSDDTRLTLVTCWPASSNAYRLIIVAVPG